MGRATSPSARKRLTPLAAGELKRVGANLDAAIYNQLIDYADKLDVDLSWFVRHALKQFINAHSDQLKKNPTQLLLDLDSN